jgi:hypothetical protein
MTKAREEYDRAMRAIDATSAGGVVQGHPDLGSRYGWLNHGTE